MYKIKATIKKNGIIMMGIQGLHPLLGNKIIRAEFATLLHHHTNTTAGVVIDPTGIDEIVNGFVSRLIDEFMYQMYERSADADIENPYQYVVWVHGKKSKAAQAFAQHYYTATSTSLGWAQEIANGVQFDDFSIPTTSSSSGDNNGG